jgi:enoyl-CoA hydratase
VSVEVTTADGLTTVSLNRPPVNALNLELQRDLEEAVLRAMHVEPGRVVLIGAAAGLRAFCAGVDLKENLSDALLVARRSALSRSMLTQLSDGPKPTIAVVTGPARGAGSVIAAACDLCVAGSEASFGLPEIRAGYLGGSAYLRRVIPRGVLRRMYFTGEPISAQEALRAGLVAQLVDGDAAEVMAAARVLAATIGQTPPETLLLAKRALNQAELVPVDDGYRIENGYTALLRRHRPEANE